MIRRQIKAVRKDSDDDITHVCHSGQLWSPRKVADVIDDIESENYEYFVDEDNTPETIVHVVDDPDGKYIRTTADSSSKNNLDNLPPC